MSVVVLTSAGAAPGVTTAALGLTLAWPRPVILVDADRQPTQAILAGYLGGADPLGRGLSTYALEVREAGRMGNVLSHCLALSASGDKHFLAGFANVGSAQLFDPVWPTLTHALRAGDTDVVIDAGRIGAGLPSALLAGADRVVVVTRSSLRSVAAQRLYVTGLAEQLAAGHAHAELLVVGPGRPYGSGEIADVLGLPVAGELPWDPVRAGVLSDGVAGDRRFAKSSLASAFVRVAAGWVADLDRAQELVAAGAPA